MFKNLKRFETFSRAEVPNLRECIRPAIWLPGFALQGTVAVFTLRATICQEFTSAGIIMLPFVVWAFIFAANGGFITQGAYEELVERRAAKVVPFDSTNIA